MKLKPFPLPLNIGTDLVHLPRITRLINRRGRGPGSDFLTRFTRRILHDREQHDFRARFGLSLPSSESSASSSSSSSSSSPESNSPNLLPPHFPISVDMARWLAGRFAAKEAARKAAPAGKGAAGVGWKDVLVRVGEGGRPEVVYLEGEEGRVGRLSISHDGEYVVATVLAGSE